MADFRWTFVGLCVVAFGQFHSSTFAGTIVSDNKIIRGSRQFPVISIATAVRRECHDILNSTAVLLPSPESPTLTYVFCAFAEDPSLFVKIPFEAGLLFYYLYCIPDHDRKNLPKGHICNIQWNQDPNK